MSLTTVERTILEKYARDAGWEIAAETSEGSVKLFSSFFGETARIQKDGQDLFSLSLSRRLDPARLDSSVRLASGGEFVFSHDEVYKIRAVLRRAAELFASLPDTPLENYRKKLSEFSDAGIQHTESERLVKERVGQDIYRDALVNYWGGSCAGTGCMLKDALRASHAKPWKDCESDAERLNVYNGFLLTANLDALFDKGYISFTDEGLIMISSHLEPSDLSPLGLSPHLSLRWLEEGHKPFLAYHREHVWKN